MLEIEFNVKSAFWVATSRQIASQAGRTIGVIRRLQTEGRGNAMTSTPPEEIYRLVDRLSAVELDQVARYIRKKKALIKRLDILHANAPIDDEPLTEEDLRALAESDEDIAAGRMTPMSKLRLKSRDR
jgi:hypothetical protein